LAWTNSGLNNSNKWRRVGSLRYSPNIVKITENQNKRECREDVLINSINI
jgi:hypothetical protein